MTCQEVTKLLTEDIQAMNQLKVRAHLAQCLECEEFRGELLSLESLAGLLRDQVRAPSDFSSKVDSSLRESSSGWKPVFAVVAVVLVSLIALWGVKNGYGVFESEQSVVSSREVKQEYTLPGRTGAVELPRLDPRSDDYVEVILDGPSEPEYILRLPSRIEIRRSQLHRDSSLKHVSH